ncbi:MAG: hypothetical protein Athens071416_16 [Parcubacteria group bacterium Athens0714_16]|nr:MAG: hypothetical protein Athens071416_16 [Parcubacteria group bacterium Athens0714_16]
MDLNQAIADGTFRDVMGIVSEVLGEPRESINAGTILPQEKKCCVCSCLVQRKGFLIDCKSNNCFRLFPGQNDNGNDDNEVFVASLVKNNILPSQK